MDQNPGPDAAQRVDPALVARRIDDRRRQLGLTEEALARQTAMATRYLRHLMEAGPAFDPAAFVRIAAVLRTTYGELLSGRADAPPGQGGAGARPLLLHLTEPECWDRVGTHGIGRIGLPTRPAPAVFPVNYTVDARTIVYHTSAHGTSAPPDGSPVSFQVDHIDESLSRGWSVLILGRAQYVEDPDEIARLKELPGSTPWAGGGRDLWVRIRPDETNGRRITSG
ncbi:helix-turn-helix domain-containing protein [Kitasatospora sp. NPDC059973]|uniref:helix-turn-helix domain-containing protein n=1 Tax=Kitasatospora sp. NPDC059973 TaxID=3347020 RepID=UPI00367677C5